MINLETFLKCSSCFDRIQVYDHTLKHVYNHLVKNLLSIYIEISDGRCNSQEEYLRMVALAKERAETLDFLLKTEKERV